MTDLVDAFLFVCLFVNFNVDDCFFSQRASQIRSMPFTGDSSDSSDGEEYLEGSGSTARPGLSSLEMKRQRQRHKRTQIKFWGRVCHLLKYCLRLLLLLLPGSQLSFSLSQRYSPATCCLANFYCQHCFSRQSIFMSVFSFLFEAIYYKLEGLHTTLHWVLYIHQFP